MANELSFKKSLTWSGVASEALTAYTQVVIDWDASTVSYAASAGDEVDGVVLVNAAAGEQVEVVLEGIVPVKVVTAASIVKNSYLQSNTSGQALLAVTADNSILKAKQAGGADGNIILAQLVGNVTIA